MKQNTSRSFCCYFCCYCLCIFSVASMLTTVLYTLFPSYIFLLLVMQNSPILFFLLLINFYIFLFFHWYIFTYLNSLYFLCIHLTDLFSFIHARQQNFPFAKSTLKMSNKKKHVWTRMSQIHYLGFISRKPLEPLFLLHSFIFPVYLTFILLFYDFFVYFFIYIYVPVSQLSLRLIRFVTFKFVIFLFFSSYVFHSVRFCFSSFRCYTKTHLTIQRIALRLLPSLKNIRSIDSFIGFIN